MLPHNYYLLHAPRGLDSVFPEVNLNRSWAFVALLSWMVQARALDEAMVEHWRYIEAEVQKLPADNPNFDVDLKPHDIDGPLIQCKSELENVPKVSLNMRWGKCLRVRMSPRPRHPMEHRGEVLSAWFPCVALARGAD